MKSEKSLVSDTYQIISNVNVPFEALHFPKWRRTTKTYKTTKPIAAVDTETANGQVWLIAASNGEYVFTDDFLTVLEWMNTTELDKSINFMYNLDFDARALLNDIPRYVLEELWLMGELTLEECFIRYIPHKFFKVKYKKKSYEFYDIAQFFHMGLDAAAKKFLGEGKSDIDAERINNSALYRRRNKQKILKYCIRDAELTQRLGDYLRSLFEGVGISPRRFFSSGYVAEQYFLKHAQIPILHFKQPQSYAYYSYAGGRFEVFQRGYFEDLNKYDLHSAYPAIMANLPNLDRGHWVSSIQPDSDADLSFTMVKVATPQQYIQPLHIRRSYNVLFPAMSYHHRVITKGEYDLITDFDLADMTPIKSWNFHAHDDSKPFGALRDIYKKRVILKDEDNPLELALKIVMNSIYGKTIQVTNVLTPRQHYLTGNIFLPAYASEITARTRVRLVRDCLEQDITPVAFFTDAILTEDTLNGCRDELGGWSLEKRAEAVILGSGVYAFRDGVNEHVKLRGFKRVRDMSLFSMLENNARKSSIAVPQRRVLTLGQYLRHYHKYAGLAMNTFMEDSKAISINFDVKRDWDREFTSCHDVLHSVIDSKSVVVNV